MLRKLFKKFIRKLEMIMEETIRSMRLSVVVSKKYGATYNKENTKFRLWAPDQIGVGLILYRRDIGEELNVYEMERDGEDFVLTLDGDFDGYFYQYLVQGKRVTDPYSYACSVNSERSAIINLEDTNPVGFAESDYCDIDPSEAIIYELHVGDFTHAENSGALYFGKYLAFTELNTKYNDIYTGLSHLKELGVTHVHLLPIADFCSVDETGRTMINGTNYNWGYDPELYNVPEGNYATNPYDPKCRIREFKELVKAVHNAGMGVIMDVVYNHTFKLEDSNFQNIVPNYYYRNIDGKFTNGSGVGNEIASEKVMVRNFIIESLLYWQREYKIDGFRFDLMALTDRKTIRIAIDKLRKVNPKTIIYGEPWMGGETKLKLEAQTVWGTQNETGFALFNSDFRDAIRGDNDGSGRGFVQGNTGSKYGVEKGLIGSFNYRNMFPNVNKNPIGSINYFCAHDNLIFEDKLQKSVGDIPQINDMTKLAFGIILTAEGIPFFHAGNEFRRNKKMCENSYCSPYSLNEIDWRNKEKHFELFNYVKELIELRKKHRVFRLEDASEVLEKVTLIDSKNENVIISLCNNGDEILLCIYHNGWEKTEIPWNIILENMGVREIITNIIFDKNGNVYNKNNIHIKECDNEVIELSPISLTIFKIKG